MDKMQSDSRVQVEKKKELSGFKLGKNESFINLTKIKFEAKCPGFKTEDLQRRLGVVLQSRE